MKAKEYFAKYDPLIMDHLDKGDKKAAALVVTDLVLEMTGEVRTIMDQRKALTPTASAAVVRELNDKWNAIYTLFTKAHNGFSPIEFDAFKKLWISEVPELAKYL